MSISCLPEEARQFSLLRGGARGMLHPWPSVPQPTAQHGAPTMAPPE